MRRVVGCALAVLALLAGVVLAAPVASANGTGSCSLVGGVVHMTVNESPGEGDLSYASIRSPVRLDIGTSDGATRADAYFEDTGDWLFGRWAVASPIDGDGYWNYRVNFYYNAINQYSYIGRVRFEINKYGSTNYCTDNVYM